MKPVRIARSALIVLSALALSLSFGGCVEDLGEIDRTQANALEKTEFSGVWYRLATVADIPISGAFGFVGLTNFGGETGKVLFDFQEKFLIVYPTTEKVLGSDAQWHKKSIRKYWEADHRDEFMEIYVGNPVAMFPIESHFDIIRDYSTATGAQSNVLVENTTDRPWYERDYVRVDWMGNTLPDIMFPQESIKYSAADYYVQDNEQDDPNRFHQEEGYFHYTRRLFGEPMSTGACSTYNLAAGDCSGATFDVRVSFRRADPRRVNDYDVRAYHNRDAGDKFGFFLADRYTFDEEYGLTYTGHDYKAQRWNLWKTTKTWTPATDEAGAPITCLSNFDCAKPALCQQDDWFKPGVCSIGHRIAYTDRGARPVIYHLSQDHPVDHMRGTYLSADSWDDAFKETVSWLYFWEEKWTKDGIPSFGNDGQGQFGQRFCSANADCAAHALAQVDVPNDSGTNRVVVATAKGTIVADEGDRDSLAGSAWVVFVNASPDSTAASLTFGNTKIDAVAFETGYVDGAHSAQVASSATGRYDLSVSADGKTAKLPNALIESNRVHFVIYYGGDSVALLRSAPTKKGLRAFNALPTGVADGDSAYSTGAAVEVGANGILQDRNLAYGAGTDYLNFTGSVAHVVFLASGARSDVSCRDVNGVGQCVGWGQQLVNADRARRLEIKTNLKESLFVLCQNVWTGGCSAAEKGNRAVNNDCRYTWIDDKGAEHNPCRDNVTHPTTPKIIGDARYNYIYWTTKPNTGSPLGYGPSAADPDTGELFWGTAYIYGAPLVTYAQYGKDIVDLINGDLLPESLGIGTYIKEYLANENKSGYDESLYSATGDDAAAKAVAVLSDDPMVAAAGRATLDFGAGLNKTNGGGQIDLHDAERAVFDLQTHPEKMKAMVEKSVPTFDIHESIARLEKIRGTPLEGAMINDEMALVLSEGDVQPGEAVVPEQLGAISPAGWATPQQGLDERERTLFLGRHSIMPQEFNDPTVVGLAKRMKCDPGETPTMTFEGDEIGDKVCYKGDALRTALSVAMFRGVLEHEIGHTVGLRHNFSASSDVFNYFDEYFDNGREREMVLCADIDIGGGNTLGGDDQCESSLGETCVKLSCNSDSDCPGGLACGGGQCVDSGGVQMGGCHATVKKPITCAADNAGLCGSGNVCRDDGVCGARVKCTKDDSCDDGSTCSAGFCVSAKTGVPASTPIFDETTDFVKKFVPRGHMTPKEQENRRMEYQYASIMDYGQKMHSDIHGLGKYDYAAIKYGYGELSEVFADMSFARDQLVTYAKSFGEEPENASGAIATQYWQYAGAFTHPFYYINDWMPPKLLRSRDSVPARWVVLEQANSVKFGREDYDRTLFEVPYKYCSDEYRGGSLGCYYFDTGAHMEEIAWHAAHALQEYYIFDAFKRERMWFGSYGNPMSYFNRIMDRWMNPIGSAARYYALYNNIYRVNGWFPWWDNNPFRGAPLRRSSEFAFRALSGILAAPAPGSFTWDADHEAYRNVSYESGAAGAQVNVPFGVGKPPWTTFASENGYYYFQHPQWIGAYWEKVAAIVTMTNSTASFLSDYVGEQLPIFRATAIGFNTIYPKEIASLLGGVAANALGEFAGYVDSKSGEYRARDPFKALPANAKLVEPSVTNLSLRLFAAWQATANLPAGFDPSFTDSMAVWLKGQGQSFEHGGGVESVEYADPFGKKTYVALRPQYHEQYFAPGFYMVTQLNELKAKWQAAPDGADKDGLALRMKSELEVLDYLRMLYALYGQIGS